MSTNEEGYINMELVTSSPSKDIEFEFQMSFPCKNDQQQENNTSPADELFYKGKLLPLHLRPRRQIIESLSASEITKMPFQESHHLYHHHHHHSMPLIDYRDISPSESCRVSCDQDYYNFFEFSNDLSRLPMKKPKRFKLAQKLKDNLSKVEAVFSKYFKISKKGSPRHISRSSCPKVANFIEDNNIHRKSFSDTVKRHSLTKCLSSSSSDSSSGASSSSSSFSLRSNSHHELSFLRSSSSVNEIEASINAAIDHCKKSMQIFHAINLDEDEKKARSSL